MRKTVSTELTAANIAMITLLLAEAPARLEAFSARLSAAQLREPLGPGERSFTEDLAHLINCEAVSSGAIYLALLADTCTAPHLPLRAVQGNAVRCKCEPLFSDIHPERQLGRLLRFDLLPFPDLLAYFKLRRAVLLRVLTSLKESQWSRAIREAGKKRKESVYWRARTIAMHELDHLTDLESKLEKLGTG